jgi:outer membrane protein OmpA-like peptidoglycan-associated protein
MPFNDDNYQTGHPSLNKEENKLYFTSDMPNGYGQTDIYVVDVEVDVKRDTIIYGEPQNLGGSINTSGKEMFPYISDSNKLYFSTDGHLTGYGRLDIYVSDLNKDVLIEPKNLGRPINSNKDDFAFAYQSGKKTGHFSSNRDGGKGDEDIYYFEDKIPEQEEPLACAQIAKGVVRDKVSGALLPEALVTLYKDGEKIESVIVGNDAKFEFPVDCEANYKVVGEKATYNIDDKEFITSNEADLELGLTLSLDTGCMQVAKGVVRDKQSGALLPKAVVTLYKDGEKIESVIVGNDARFEFPVNCESNYKVVGEKRTYSPDNEKFITSNELNLELDLSLNLEDDFNLVGDKLLIKINPIYFDLDKSFIRPDAAIELNKVIQVMRKYPNLVIEGGSHTDARGSKKYNEALSARRAKSTVAYIVSNGGIDPSRIFSRGYGEYQPVNRCVDYTRCSEYEHQLNRRTEFVIMNPEILQR